MPEEIFLQGKSASDEFPYFLFVWEESISFLLWGIISLDIESGCGFYFSLDTLNITLFSSCLLSFWRKTIILILVPLWVRYFFPLASFMILPFFVCFWFLFSSFSMICLVLCVCVIFLGSLWAFWIYGCCLSYILEHFDYNQLFLCCFSTSGVQIMYMFSHLVLFHISWVYCFVLIFMLPPAPHPFEY